MNSKSKAVVLYVHGKGGSAAEAEHYRPLFPEADVVGFDYHSENPWSAKAEFSEKIAALRANYDQIFLISVSIGAYFSMSADISDSIRRAWLISPIVDMERLILSMLSWAGETEEALQARKTIPTTFGEDLSWEYLQYVRSHPIQWRAPTEILYGSADSLQSIETIRAFARRFRAGVTVMEGGEHWFHTAVQMKFLDDWIRRRASN